jgi:hydroxypyruvate isomerase
MKFSANISILFPELPLKERAWAARNAGFDAVECWWPFADAAPSENETSTFVATLQRADVQLTGLNFFAGNMPAGDRGILSHPDAMDLFAANVAAVRRIADETGCRLFNALYGQRVAGVDVTLQDETAVRNLELAAGALENIGGTILLEPLSNGENGDYPLVTPGDAIAVIDRADAPAVKLLFDAYHLHNNGFDVADELRRQVQHVGHIQIADSPGRGQPGTGTIDFAGFFSAVERIGYDGVIGCEYRPRGASVDSFGWMASAVVN